MALSPSRQEVPALVAASGPRSRATGHRGPAASRHPGRRRFSVLVLVLGLLAPAVSPTRAGADELLPIDPALVTGTLANGVRYVILPHPTPEHRVGLWLHVATGSLNETEATRGVAHFLEHVAFDGSKNFPPGSVVPFFQSLGLSFGRDQNAFTSFEQTTYQLVVPSSSAEALDKSLLFLSDVAFRLTISPAEVDKERQIILEEKRTRASADQRTEDIVLERLAPGSTFGRRLPIGTEATIRALTAADLRDYYTRWYVPPAMTLIVVGEVDPAAVAAAIGRHFTTSTTGAVSLPPEPRPVGAVATGARRAVVATDPDLTRASVSVVRVEPARAPVTTVEGLRQQLVERVGHWIFSRQLDAAAARGHAAFDDGNAGVQQWPGALRLASAEVTGRPDSWRAMLTDLGTLLARARLHGFTARELEDARVALLSEAQEAVQQQSTRPVRSILHELNGRLTQGEPLVSPEQRLALLQRLLPGLTVSEVSAAFVPDFDPTRAVVVAELPAGPGVPTETGLLDLGRAALDVRPAAVAEAPRPTTILAAEPRPGSVVEETTDPATAVTSAWLDNGVRAHFRHMDQRRDRIIATITLAGGAIQETAANRGITDAATEAWERPATSDLSSVDVRDLMTGVRVQVGVRVDPDAVRLTLTGDRSGIERGFQLAYRLLTDPVLEPVALRQWKEDEAEEIRARRNDPGAALGALTASALYPPGEVRTRPLTLEEVQAVTRDAAQAWLSRLIKTAPIEVAVVGDLDRATASSLVTRYVGSLPPRPRIGDKTLHDLRVIARPKGPLAVAGTVETQTPRAVVLEGFFGADGRDTRDARLLSLASRILTTRMYRDLREARRLVYDIAAVSEPGEAYPGYGIFAAQAPTDPARAGTLAAEVNTMFDRFAADGPGETEMTVARQQIENILDEALASPEFWASRLAVLDYRGRTLADLAAMKGDYAGFTAPEVRDAFRRYHRPETRFSIVVTPAEGPTVEAPPARDRS